MQSIGLCIDKSFEACQIKLILTFFHKRLCEQMFHIPSLMLDQIYGTRKNSNLLEKKKNRSDLSPLFLETRYNLGFHEGYAIQ